MEDDQWVVALTEQERPTEPDVPSIAAEMKCLASKSSEFKKQSIKQHASDCPDVPGNGERNKVIVFGKTTGLDPKALIDEKEKNCKDCISTSNTSDLPTVEECQEKDSLPPNSNETAIVKLSSKSPDLLQDDTSHANVAMTSEPTGEAAALDHAMPSSNDVAKEENILFVSKEALKDISKIVITK